jgi:hypothetical protein
MFEQHVYGLPHRIDQAGKDQEEDPDTRTFVRQIFLEKHCATIT